MHYSNGVVEKGMFRNGVYQPPNNPTPAQSSYGGDRHDDEGTNHGDRVWSLKSSPTMASGKRASGSPPLRWRLVWKYEQQSVLRMIVYVCGVFLEAQHI